MRLTAAAAVAAALLAAPVPADAAHGGGVLRCTMTYEEGLGASSGTGTCTFTGTAHGVFYVEAPAFMSFSAYSPPSTCPLTATFSGTIVLGPLPTTFTMGMSGSIVLMSTQGSIRGIGAGSLLPANPTRPPCQGETTSHLVVALAGL